MNSATSERYEADLIGFGDMIDILPLAKDALEVCTDPTGLTALELATLCKKFAHQGRLPKGLLPHTTNDVVELLIETMVRWAQSEYRMAQVCDPDVRLLRPFLELTTDGDLCQNGSKMTGRFLACSDLVRLPMAGCWGHRCTCRYRTLSMRDLVDNGRLDSSGQAVAAAAQPPRKRNRQF